MVAIVCFLPLRTTRPLSEIIVVSDEENTPSPDNSNLVLGQNMSKPPNTSKLVQQVPFNSSEDVEALRELLHKEERKLDVLKSIHGRQGGRQVSATQPSAIQGSALNKASGRSSGSGRNSPNLRVQPKHSIVVVPGRPGATAANPGISPRLQQLVDNMTVDHANSGAQASSGNKAMVSVTTPPIPGLTSLAGSTASSRKHTTITSSSKHLQLGVPTLKPKTTTTSRASHEIITITDSPVGKKPPPLLSSSTNAAWIPTATSNGSIQVPTISSSSMHANLSNATVADKKNFLKAAESSRRYREYLLKQTHAKKNFQKQIERKMVVAPYPKTFRQVWPLIPVHDSGFVRNFGMESVLHHFDPESKALQEKTNSKVKPVCNQCGCDFASAWQIRKSNSKQLLLCEACDFQNLKILQRSKLSNQLKELLDSVKAEQVKFGGECEEARKQMLEMTSTVTAPPPLNSQLQGISAVQKGGQLVVTTGADGQVMLATTSHNTESGGHLVVTSTQKTGNIQGKVGNRHQITTTANTGKLTQQTNVAVPSRTVYQQRNVGVINQQKQLTNHVKTVGEVTNNVVVPSILGQHRVQPRPKLETGSKRPMSAGEGTAVAATAPPSKVCKPGSVLDLTLTRISKQLIERKLDEQRQEPDDGDGEGREEEGERGDPGVVVVEANVVNAKKEVLMSPTSPVPASQRTRSRRKGTPNKRLLSASSMNSE